MKQKIIFGLCMWWFFMLGDNPQTVGSFWNQDQCEGIRVWIQEKQANWTIRTPTSPCWSDQQVPPEKE